MFEWSVICAVFFILYSDGERSYDTWVCLLCLTALKLAFQKKYSKFDDSAEKCFGSMVLMIYFLLHGLRDVEANTTEEILRELFMISGGAYFLILMMLFLLFIANLLLVLNTLIMAIRHDPVFTEAECRKNKACLCLCLTYTMGTILVFSRTTYLEYTGIGKNKIWGLNNFGQIILWESLFNVICEIWAILYWLRNYEKMMMKVEEKELSWRELGLTYYTILRCFLFMTNYFVFKEFCGIRGEICWMLKELYLGEYLKLVCLFSCAYMSLGKTDSVKLDSLKEPLFIISILFEKI
eukprot:snap_masked-scaffold_10-processed-gene-1.47-mRNA-1 protein AED:1.00 eAED:1.00 QI:0/0/0/0/1/1/2/0/294